MRARAKWVAAGVTGALLFGGALWAGADRLRHADAQEALHLELRALGAGPRRIPPDTASTWRAKVQPAFLAPRVKFRVDGRATPAEIVDAKSGEIELRLDPQSLGVHAIEAELRRRGDRREAIVDTLWVGEVEARGAIAQRCVAAMSASEAAIRAAVLPPLSEKLRTALRGQPFLGDSIRIDRFELELHEGGAAVRVEVQGDNRLEVRAQLRVRRVDDQRMAVELQRLEAVNFHGSARNWARGGGLGVGALLGGPIGAVAGLILVDAYIDDKSKRVVHEEITRALSRASAVRWLPSELGVLPGEPRSQVALGFCGDPVLGEGFARVEFWMSPMQFPSPAGWPLDGPVVAGEPFVAAPLSADQDLRAEIHIDAVNALLESWAASGLLGERLAGPEQLARINAELEPWTPLRLTEVAPSVPPMLVARAPEGEGAKASEAAELEWTAHWPALALALGRSDGIAVAPGERVELSLRGALRLRWLDDPGALQLEGGVDALWLGCTRREGSIQSRRACFGPLVDAAELPRRVDEAAGQAFGALPALELGPLLYELTGTRLEAVRLEAASPTSVSFGARVAAGG